MGEVLAPLNNLVMIAMQTFFNWTGSYSWAIILVTTLVRLIITPLFVVQMGAMKRMQELQPKIKELQAKHGKDPEKLNKEMMELYRKHKVNPFSGCLPTVIQLPVLISIYNVINQFGYAGDPALFGISAILLNQPDPTYVLPALAAILTFMQTWLGGTGTDQTQKTMLFIFPVMIFWFSMSVHAGVTLYWVISTLLTIIQQGIYPGFRRPLLPKGETAVR